MEIIVNRFAKIFGGVVKGFGYLFHALFPNKRFILPKVSKAKVASGKNLKIPKIIWQTNFTNKASLPVYVNYLFIRLMSLDWEYRYVSTEDRGEYMKNNASEDEYNAFKRLKNGAAQADFWRVFVLNKIGGVYLDIDAHPVWPLSKMIKEDDSEVILLNKEHYTNYFIASAPNNPTLQKTVELIVDNINNDRVEGGVYALSGPLVLNEAIGSRDVNHRYYKYTCIQGSFTNEHFQYIDRPKSKWTYLKNDEILEPK